MAEQIQSPTTNQRDMLREIPLSRIVVPEGSTRGGR